jgi:hypothetical protein
MTGSKDERAQVEARIAVTRDRVAAIRGQTIAKIADSPEVVDMEPDPEKRLAFAERMLDRDYAAWQRSVGLADKP